MREQLNIKATIALSALVAVPVLALGFAMGPAHANSSHGLNDDRTVAAFNVWAETVPA